jgi:hypothetical protein
MKQTVATDIALAAVAAVGINLKIRARPLSKLYPSDSEEAVASGFLAFHQKMDDCSE